MHGSPSAPPGSDEPARPDVGAGPVEAAWTAIERDVLSGLRGLSATLQRALRLELPAELQGELTTSVASADAVEACLGEIAELARLVAGRQPPDAETFDPLALAERLVLERAPTAWGRRVELAAVPDGPLPAAAHGAAEMLEATLGPILDGALDGARPGRIDLGVRFDAERGSWIFAVRGGATPALRAPRRGRRALVAALVEARLAALGARLERNLGEEVARHLHVPLGAVDGVVHGPRVARELRIVHYAAGATSGAVTRALLAAIGAEATTTTMVEELGELARGADVLLVDGERWGAARELLDVLEGPRPATVWLAASSQAPDAAAFAALRADLWLTRPLDRARLVGALALLGESGADAREPLAAAPRPPRPTAWRVLVAHGHLMQQAELAARLDAAGLDVALADDAAGLDLALIRGPVDAVVFGADLDGLDPVRLEAALLHVARSATPPKVVCLAHGSAEAWAADLHLVPDDLAACAAAIVTMLERDPSDGPPMNDPTDDVLDRDVIASLRELEEPGESGLLEELVALFLADAPPRVEALERALAEGDARELERVAHSLKSSCGNLGAASLAEVCRQIEQAGRAGRLEGTAPLVARSRQLLQQVQRALEAEVDSH